MAPVRTIQIKENYAPWLSNETKASMTERDQAQQTAPMSKSEEDWNSYKRQRNQVNGKFRNDKRDWQRQKFKSVRKKMTGSRYGRM